MERDRIILGPGIAIFREWNCWLLDLSMGKKRVRKSLKTDDKWKALEFVAQAHQRAEPFTPASERFAPAQQGNQVHLAGFQGPDIFRPPGMAPAPVIPRVVARPVPRTTIDEAITLYTSYLRDNKSDSPEHVQNVGNQIRMFRTFAKLDRMDQIEARHIVEYLNSFAGKAARTRRQKLWTLRTWLRWCIKLGFRSSDPTDGLSPPRIKRKKVRYLSFEEVGRLLAASEGTPVDDALKAALYTGLRFKELRNLDLSDVDLKARWLNLERTKTDRPRDIPIFDQSLRCFQRFVRQGTFGITKSGYWDRQLKAVFKKAQVLEPGFKILRRTFATNLLLLGVEQYVVAQWDGHDLSTQERHYAGYRRSDQPMRITWFGKRIPKDGRLKVPRQR